MSPEKKRKLRNIALLALLGLIGGTFAFTAFNQQAINDRLRENQTDVVGGRVHDYFNREEENKDIFVENFGQEPIMVRLRLSEFMEIQERGQSSFTPVVEGTSRTNTQGWPYYIPEGDSLTTRTGAGAAFNIYSELTFGWEGNGTAPWYLPTFNTVYNDDRTAAAGDARDYEADGTTHPGTGRADQWAEGGSFDNSNNAYPGAGVTRYTAQTLPQDLAPRTSGEVTTATLVGNFWIIDHETGWAYWANQLNGGQATSYLLDAAKMLPDADNINGSYYYVIHVESELISVDQSFRDEPADGVISQLLTEIRGVRGTGNPAPTTVSHPKAFNFSRMIDTAGANTRFTVANPDGTDAQVFRYLNGPGDSERPGMGTGNHLILRDNVIRNVSWDEHDDALKDWFDTELPADLRAMVAPVAREFTTGNAPLAWDGVSLGAAGWSVEGLENFPEVAADLTEVDPDGVPSAFALSLADVLRLSVVPPSTPNIGFMNVMDRIGGPIHTPGWWWLRTPSQHAWLVNIFGGLSHTQRPTSNEGGGIRPALIIHQ